MLYEGRDTRQSTASRAANIRRATECAQDARKAVSALLSLGSSPVTEEAVKEMKEKHPEAPKPKLPGGPPPEALRFEPDVVRRKVEGFPAGSAAGASGARPQFFKDMFVLTKQWAKLRCLRSQV